MTWVRKTPAEAPHACETPTCEAVYQFPSMMGEGPGTEHRETIPDGSLGDLWRCDECNRLWRIGLACDLCDRQGDYPHGGMHASGYMWRPARWWQRIAHHRTKEAE